MTTKLYVSFSSRSDINQLICDELDNASVAIFIAMYTLTNIALINKIIEVRGKGIEVLAIFDHAQAVKYSDLIFKLINADVICKTTGNEKISMHNKFIVIDAILSITGSFNWTNRATNNFENVIFVKNSKISQEYLSEFNYMWKLITNDSYDKNINDQCNEKLKALIEDMKREEESIPQPRDLLALRKDLDKVRAINEELKTKNEELETKNEELETKIKTIIKEEKIAKIRMRMEVLKELKLPS